MADDTGPPPPPVPLAAPPPRTEPLAFWSLVLSIPFLIFGWLLCFIGLILGVLAIVFGHVARSRIRKSGGQVGGMKMALAGLIIAYIGLVPVVVLSSFAAAMLFDMIRSDRERLHDLAVKRQEITSDDGKLKIITSGFWVKASDLNKQATLQAQYKSNDMYVMVISDSKATVGNMTLEQHHQLTRDHMLQKLEKSSATQSASVTVDGHPALQDEISGTRQRTNLTFLHTTIDEGDAYQQILAWTTQHRWPKQNPELRDITGSFHSGATTPAPSP